MNKNAVVFGATGLVGRELIAELLDHSEFETVIMVVRKRFPVLNPRIEQLQTDDFTRLPDLKSRLTASAYFCCIGTTIKVAGSKNAFRKVDLDIPVLIARMAQEMSVPALVVISSIGANDLSRNFYLRTKGEMEKKVRSIYTGNLKIVRPSLLVGKRNEYRFAEKLSVPIMKAFGWLFTGTYRKYRCIHAKDVARAMVNAVKFPAGKWVLESDELQDLATK